MRAITKIAGFLCAAGLLGPAAWGELQVTRRPLSNTIGPAGIGLHGGGQELQRLSAAGRRRVGDPQERCGRLREPDRAVPDVHRLTATSAAMADDLHGLTPAPALVTCINYVYLNTSTTAAQTHTIKMYAMVPPSGTHGTTPTGALLDKGAAAHLHRAAVPGGLGLLQHEPDRPEHQRAGFGRVDELQGLGRRER